MNKISFIASVFILVVIGCKEKYDPPLGSISKPLLVVEANLDPKGPALIRLSRTTAVNSSNTIVAENNAQVVIEGKDNTTQLVPATGNGNYSSSNPLLIIGNEYRLRIKTIGGDEFLSAYVKAKRTPPIDSISWERTNKGVQIFANTRDPLNATNYYRWDYVETWEIHSYYNSIYVYKNRGIRSRIFPQEDISVCWKTSPSTNICLANSLRLQADIISRAPLVFIPEGDEKLFVRYSIIARQYSLDADGYKFYEILKKNTEEIGTFFGPLPSELKGNIQCVNKPDEPVIGFVTASETNEKRIFIDHSQIPNSWSDVTFCPEISVAANPDSLADAASTLVPYGAGFSPSGSLRYFFSTPYCVDCTSRGGVTVKPSFW
jgi:hypothetical protein